GWLPSEYGGAGLDYKSMGVLGEELARGWAGLAGTVLVDGGNGGVPGGSGDAIAPAPISEPNVGSDASSIQTTAVLDGDDWVVNGTKQWISNGPIADHVFVAVQ